MDKRATSGSYDSEGLHAHLYLSGLPSPSPPPKQWEAYYHSPKLARVLKRKKAGWKKAKTRPVLQTTALPKRPVQLTLDFSINERQFQTLVDRWRRETRHISSVTKASMHQDYQRIIGFGRDALPFIFRELQQRGGHWLWALHAITGEDPAPTNATFREAVQAWLDWGRRQGYLT